MADECGLAVLQSGSGPREGGASGSSPCQGAMPAVPAGPGLALQGGPQYTQRYESRVSSTMP